MDEPANPATAPVSQPLHERRRRHHQVRGAVAPSCLQLQHHSPGGVQAETLHVGAQRLVEAGLRGKRACVLPEARARGTHLIEGASHHRSMLSSSARLKSRETFAASSMFLRSWMDGNSSSTCRLILVRTYS